MIWILCGLAASLFWAVTNIIDQILMRKLYADKPLLIMTLCGFVSTIPFIMIGAYDPSVFSTDTTVATLFIITSIINSCGFLAYFRALEIDEASNAVPLFQLQPIFIFIAAYFLFGETITVPQGVGVLLILIAALSILIDFENKKYNWRTLYLIGLSGLVLSSTTLLDRYLLADVSWVSGMFWKSLGYIVFSIIVVALHSKTRIETFEKIKKPKSYGIHLIIIVAIFGIVGDMFFLASLELTTAAGLTQTLTGAMPFFLLALGYIGYRIAPDHIKKSKTGKHLGWHLACLIVMVFGLYLIY